MLGTTLWFVVVMGLMAAALMDGAAAFGRAGVQAAADHALEGALRDALADYQNRLAAVVPSGAPLPAVSVTPAPQAADGGPGLSVAYDVTPTTVAAPACAAPAQTGADTVAWLQCHALVRESRASLRVTVRVYDSGGTQLLAQRAQTITLRLFALPPYSALVGQSDSAADGPAGGDALTPPAHEGDISNAGGGGSGALAQASPWPQGGPLVHVRYQCSAGDCADAAPPDPDAALRPGARWTNGNATAP